MNQILDSNKKELENKANKLNSDVKTTVGSHKVSQKSPARAQTMSGSRPSGKRKVVINTKKVKALILLITFTMFFFITTIYAWLSTQKNVSINNMRGKVEVAEGLQISMDAEEWSQEIELGTVTRTAGLLSTIETVEADWSEYDEGVGAARRTFSCRIS